MRVSVCYSPAPGETVLMECEIHQSATVEDAIKAAGLWTRFPHVDPHQAKIGLFGKPTTWDASLQPGDRVEIYRPLVYDPKDSRRRRAAHRNRPTPKQALAAEALSK